MKKFLPTLFVALCGLALATVSGWAQTGTKRIETPARATVPRNQPSVPIPSTPAPQQGQGVPQQQLSAPSIRVQPRPFNLDTALSRILADHQAVTAKGEFELSTTNAGKVEVTTLPLTLHLMEGRVRTELDITSVPMRANFNGPFTPFRQAGITRLVNLTVFNTTLRLTYQLFPEVKAHITQPLPAEELPFLIKLESRSLGADTLNGIACEKFLATLTYPTGDKRDARLWKSGTGASAQPVQVQFDVGDSLITVRLRSLQNFGSLNAKETALRMAALFALPLDSKEYPDAGYMLQAISAHQIRALR